MKKAIVVSTILESSNTWLPNFLGSFKTYPKYPLIILPQDTWELGRIDWVLKNTNYDEFFLVHDTVEIHKPDELFELLFDTHPNTTTHLFNYGGGYFVKYYRAILEQINFPERAITKDESVEYEVALHHRYFEKETSLGLPHLQLFTNYTNRLVEKFGRLNLATGNEYFTKYMKIESEEWFRDTFPKEYKELEQTNL